VSTSDGRFPEKSTKSFSPARCTCRIDGLSTRAPAAIALAKLAIGKARRVRGPILGPEQVQGDPWAFEFLVQVRPRRYRPVPAGRIRRARKQARLQGGVVQVVGQRPRHARGGGAGQIRRHRAQTDATRLGNRPVGQARLVFQAQTDPRATVGGQTDATFRPNSNHLVPNMAAYSPAGDNRWPALVHPSLVHSPRYLMFSRVSSLSIVCEVGHDLAQSSTV